MQICRFSMLLAGMGMALTVNAQTLAAPQNVVQLAGSGAVEVAQDVLSTTLMVSREGTDAGAVQGQLQRALDAALQEVKVTSQAGAMDVRTGNFNLQPRYNRDGKSAGWVGTAELVLEGRDFLRIATAATRAQTMTVANVAFTVSRETRARAEEQAQALAIERFRQRASDIARGFGFSAYTLREISVSGDEQGSFGPRPQMLAMNRVAAADAPLPVESGKTTVLVSVRGSVQLK